MRHRLFFILLLIPFSISAQISPGDLTKAHANLEGLSNCTSCHEIGERVKNSKCLSCHSEVNELINRKKGYHSTAEVTSKNCADCHSEHHGRNFRIVNFNPDKFDHSKTTFLLSGKHSEIKCTACHNKMNIDNSEALKKNSRWMGLSTSCISCHEDYHQGTLGKDCTGCHNTRAFRPSEFDHKKSSFILTGAHIKTLCIKCHPVTKKEGKEYQKFKEVQFSSCESCHKDVHNGRLGKDCKSCHNTISFRTINQSAFDHSKTEFPLLGRHNNVSCNSCHKSSFSERLKHNNCFDCHTDYHRGEFVSKDGLINCSQCHSEQGFTPSLFTIERHSNTKFPLAGAHLAVPCADCHKTDNRWTFRKAGTDCIDCHKNIHEDEITTRFTSGKGCINCHEVSSWSTISFEHSLTEFPLEGKHALVSCRSCHFIDNNVSKQRFATLNRYCTGCHSDVHSKQFGYGDSEECSRCHTYDNWKPDKFNHNQTRFSLEGAHSKLKCSECHKPVTTADNTFIKYKLEDFRCASCHS